MLTVEEKVSLLSGSSPAVPRLELPAYGWARECERGDGSGKPGMAYPSGAALGMTWNVTLVNMIAQTIAVEVRAGFDTGIGGGTSCFGPVVNLIRDPRW